MEWLAVIIVFSGMVLIHELGHFLMALKVGIKVEIFSLGFGPRIFSFTKNGIEYRISAVPFGGYVKMAAENPEEGTTGQPQEFLSQSVGNRFKVIFAGPLLNYILGFVLFSFVFYAGYPILTTQIGGLMDGYPAKEAGVKAKDRILAINGNPVSDWDEMTRVIQKKAGEDLILTIDREGKRIELPLKPQAKETKDVLGKKIKVGLIGVMPSDKIEYARYGFFESLRRGGGRLISITVLTYRGLWNLITGQLPFKESVSGPVGIFTIMASAAKMGIMPLLHLTAYISALIAIFNLLPIPALDGGIILFLGIEKIIRRPISRKAQEMAMRIGWSFLIALMLLATYNDLFRLFKR